MKFTISTGEIRTLRSVLWFLQKCENTNTNYLFDSECVHEDDDNDDNKIIDFIAYDNVFISTYKEYKIQLTRTRYGEPVFINSRCEAGNYEELVLEFMDDSISFDKQTECIKELILESKKKFTENKRYKYSDEKLTLWSYSSGYWDDIKRIHKRHIDTVILDENVKVDIKKSIDRYNNKDYKKKLRSFGINHKMNLVFSCLLGTGKTSLLFAVATLLDKDIATLDFNNKEITDHTFIQALNRIPKDTVFVMEDIDALYIDREKSRDNSISFSVILNFLDGTYSKDDLVTVITTNHLNRLDKALIRPMRIDKILKFTYCSKYQYETLFNKIFPDNNEIMKQLYKIIKTKKFTTSMIQKFFITYLDEPKSLLDNVAVFDELINTSSDKDYNMFT